MRGGSSVAPTLGSACLFLKKSVTTCLQCPSGLDTHSRTPALPTQSPRDFRLQAIGLTPSGRTLKLKTPIWVQSGDRNLMRDGKLGKELPSPEQDERVNIKNGYAIVYR